MPRQVTFALGFVAILFSAGSVGSQDPFRARSEAESAARAVPIYAPDTAPQLPAERPGVEELPAVHAPMSLVPQAQLVATVPADLVQAPQAPFNQADLLTSSEGTVETQPLSTLAERRLLATVPDDIEPYFDLFMYVSKSTRGPLAQHMFIFQRDADGKIIPYAEWKVSTGREKIELHNERKVRTNTPEGIFQLDPDRMHKKYWSHSWNNAPMHYAMFYDLLNNGNQSGLAIHAAIGASKIARLGRRDSAGCIRLAPKNAKELFLKVRSTLKGQVPVLALNERRSTDRWGRVEKDANGATLMQDGYRAVLFVENYDGREEVVGPVVAYTN